MRSCDVSPAIEAATATTAPTVSAATLPLSSVHPSSRNTDEVASSVAIVMPLVGFAVTPTSPTMRELTVTKKNANTTTSMAATARPAGISMLLNARGTSTSVAKTSAAPTPTTRSGRSCSVRGTAGAPGVSDRRSRIWRAPDRKLSTISGTLRSSVISPAVATAPAPMYRIYRVQSRLGVMASSGRTVSG